MKGNSPIKTCFPRLTLLLLIGLSMHLINQKSHAGSLEVLHEALPRHIRGWTAEPGDRYFDTETIFDYINGAGEVYRAYNMLKCLSRRYTNPDGPPILLDIFHMGSSEDAFGVFTHDQDGDALQIGQGALYRYGWLSFWKDRYFVSIYSEGETAAAKTTAVELGKSVASLIKGRGSKPRILALLPPEGLQPGSIRYLHHHIVLNYHFYLSNENILDLGPHTDAALAEYRRDDQSAWLLLVRYPSEGKARRAHANLLKHYLPEAHAAVPVLLENGRWSAAASKGSLLAAVFDAQSRELAKDLLQGIMQTPSSY